MTEVTRKEALQIDADRAADEEDAEDDGHGDAEDGSGEAHELGGVERNSRQDEDGFDAFAEHEQEDEKEQRSLVGRLQGLGDLAFNFALHGFRGLVHEPDHGDNKGGGGEHDPTFENVGVETGAGDQDGAENGRGDGSAKRPEDGAFEFGTTDFGEVREDDADDERGFDAFSKRDDEGLQHCF